MTIQKPSHKANGWGTEGTLLYVRYSTVTVVYTSGAPSFGPAGWLTPPTRIESQGHETILSGPRVLGLGSGCPVTTPHPKVPHVPGLVPGAWCSPAWPCVLGLGAQPST